MDWEVCVNRKLVSVAMMVGLLTACGRDEASDREVEAIKKRMSVLEDRAKAERRDDRGDDKKGTKSDRDKGGKNDKGKGGKAEKGGKSSKGGKGGKDGDRPAGVEITLTGGAEKAALVEGSRRFDLPAKVPAGSYTVMANFGQGWGAAGKVDVAEAPLALVCDAAAKSCTAQ